MVSLCTGRQTGVSRSYSCSGHHSVGIYLLTGVVDSVHFAFDMVSIQFPGGNEKKLEFTQWVPDQSEEVIQKITDAKRLEEIINEITHKIEKLEQSQ